MKVSTVLKPAMLFAAGSAASVASAAPTIDTTSYDATREGSLITLAGASGPQYNFQLQTRDFVGPKDGYYLIGLDGARVSQINFSDPQNAQNAPQFTNEAKTGTPNIVARAIDSDTYYGLRFSANGQNYKGFAGLINGGATINQIGYELAGVPEPSTWALMIAGFGGVGLAMRRRRRQAPAIASALSVVA